MYIYITVDILTKIHKYISILNTFINFDQYLGKNNIVRKEKFVLSPIPDFGNHLQPFCKVEFVHTITTINELLAITICKLQ